MKFPDTMECIRAEKAVPPLCRRVVPVIAAVLFGFTGCAPEPEREGVSVRIAQSTDGNFTLLRNGEPFIMRGAGGRSHIDALVAAGGNTVRTWGVDDLEREIDGQPFLDRMHEKGLAVLAGIWLQHERHGFDYTDPEQLKHQRRVVREVVETYRDHPAIVVWGLGNEMEAFRGDADDAPVWREVNILARIVKEADPRRPVMSTVAGVTPRKVASILRHAPEVDILGVNAYAAAIRTGEILNEAGWNRPFVLAEFGPRGHWEVPLTPWGAPIEPTSEEKARYYLRTHQTVMEDAGDRCVGTFAFLWGHKQEVTHTWYGMFLPSGEKLPAVDAMTYAWSGRYPEIRCPELLSVHFPGNGAAVAPGTRWHVSAEAVDPGGFPLDFAWEVVAEQADPAVGGDHEDPPPRHPEAILAASGNTAAVRAPETPGAYRLFITVRNNRNSATVANFPFKVEEP